ncbi:MAG TPA: hypothetical protein VIM58_04710 [Candidatus Methylacidiphilales bacterium]
MSPRRSCGCSLLLLLCLALAPGRAGAGEKALPVPTAAQIEALAALLPAQPAGVGRPIGDRAAWEQAARQPAFQKELRDAERYAKEPIPELTPALYRDILKSGQRDPYEVPFRKRSTRLVAFVVAECVRNDGTYLPKIEEELRAILGEESWTVPSSQ